jgi:predicted RNase H-like nuclease
VSGKLSMGRKYIGVDLGAWYGKKTRIATLEENEENREVHLTYIDSELMEKDPYKRNEELVKILKTRAKDNAIIGIDAPFAVPSHLCNPIETGSNREPLYNPEGAIIGELANQFIYDNSARFVYSKTGERALAPAGDKIGKMTARMVHIASKYKEELNVIKTPYIDTNMKGISTIEVYPRATLKNILFEKNETINPYKGDKWNGKKSDMIERLSKWINIPEELHNQIITDDDYDAIICALTAYLVSHEYYGYEKPKEEDLDKFTNSFIYIPKI